MTVGERDGMTGQQDERRAEDVDVRIGTVVDKYTIVRLLGKGGMGAVYEARHAKLSRRFALKFLLPELAARPEILRRFENEAKAAGGLEHANLVAATDFGSSADGAPYIVMEFLQGEDCSTLLYRLGPLPVARAADVVLQACRGLAVAHESGIIHRDLKPKNIFLADAGDGSDLVKVLDFGIAKLRSAKGALSTGTGTTFGTAHYMSPEQARGAGEVDERTDVWSLGVVLYELLTGRTPFQGDQFLYVIHEILSAEPRPLAALRSGLPPALVAAVERAMAKDVRHRFPTVRALAEALTPFARRTSIARASAPSSPVATLPTPVTAACTVAAGKTGGPGGTAAGGGAADRRATALALLVAVAAGVVILVARVDDRGPPRPADPTPVTAPASAVAAPGPAPVSERLPPRAVRSPSEPSEHDSNSSPTPAYRAPVRRKTNQPAAVVGGELLRTAESAAPRDKDGPPTPAERGVTIDSANPY